MLQEVELKAGGPAPVYGRAGSACRRGAPRPVRDPARPRRAEDAEDIARLEAALRRRAGG
ncbi:MULTISPECIES: hypothetical protein [Streptomyces]|uniref:Uncharacterized protein n=1 Tax=Streptomyces bangladeshensis TaxID=295352 RepID=A0ABN3BMW1_9ACTN|nr:hypothetical protein [Streptomyces sp. FBKL.4005]